MFRFAHVQIQPQIHCFYCSSTAKDLEILSSCGFRMADDAASEQKTVNGIVIPPANGMLERLQEVSCDKNTLPVYSVSQTDCIIHKGTISLICAFCG